MIKCFIFPPDKRQARARIRELGDIWISIVWISVYPNIYIWRYISYILIYIYIKRQNKACIRELDDIWISRHLHLRCGLHSHLLSTIHIWVWQRIQCHKVQNWWRSAKMFNLDGRTFGAVTFDTEQRPGARRDYKQQHKAEGTPLGVLCWWIKPKIGPRNPSLNQLSAKKTCPRNQFQKILGCGGDGR